jgi:hypothetical protein
MQGSPATVSDVEIDLGSPVSARGGDEPSGASFFSWDLLVRSRSAPDGSDDPPVRFSSLSKAELWLPPIGADGSALASRRNGLPDDVEIDLGSPVEARKALGGPLSGESFYSWALLVPRREDSSSASVERPVRIRPLSNPDVILPPSARTRALPRKQTAQRPPRRWWIGLLCGTALGIALCVGLWTAGCEPPQAWRLQVSKWFGKSSPPSAAPATPE